MAAGGRWTRGIAALAALDGFMAVAFGAFGAHGVADPAVKGWLATAAQYQGAHAVATLAALVTAWQASSGAGAWRWAAGLFALGAFVFGGSLDALALSGLRAFGAATPLGGLLLLAGWTAALVAALRTRA